MQLSMDFVYSRYVFVCMVMIELVDSIGRTSGVNLYGKVLNRILKVKNHGSLINILYAMPQTANEG